MIRGFNGRNILAVAFLLLGFFFIIIPVYAATPQVAAGGWHTVGVKTDGTVVAAGNGDYGQANVSGWTGIEQVAAGGCHTVGVKTDGTVVAVGINNNGQTSVSGWTGI
ncbi:MAG: hypothetical protein C0403_07155, partial [Desulfobacterium sp.]|nr:hypothetical protein [Desulfobacterium sp.]